MSSSSPTISENHTVASFSDTEMDPFCPPPVPVAGTSVTCHICRNTLFRPRELSCLHMFCQNCLEAMKPIEGVRSTIVCPQCDYATSLTSVNDLKPASMMAKFIACHMDPKSLRCCLCDGRYQKPIKAYCTECNGTVCSTCCDRHLSMEVLSQHTIIQLDCLPKDNMKTLTRMCPTHKIGMKFYCRTCAEAVCPECLSAQRIHSHFNNPCCYIEDEAENNVLFLQNACAPTTNEKRDELMRIDKDAEEALHILHESTQIVSDRMRQHNQWLQNLIEMSCNHTLGELKRKYTEKVKELHGVRQMAATGLRQVNALQQIFHLLPYGSSEEIISKRPIIEEKIQSLTNAMPDQPYSQNYVMNFVPDQALSNVSTCTTFGQVTCGDHNPFRNGQGQGPMQHYLPPHQVNDPSANKANSNFWDASQMNTYYNNTEESHYAQWSSGTDNIEHQQGQSNFEPSGGVIPRGVSAAPIRSNLRRAKMTYAHRFGEYGSGESQFTEPSGVAVSSQNQIICADTNNHRIQVFDAVGNYMFQFGEAGKKENQLLYPNRVAIMPLTQDLVVTERSPTHQVQIFDQHGNFKRKFGANILQHPRGVCCDNMNNIIIVECKVMRVIIFDYYGVVQSKFGCSRHLQFPNSVAVNNKKEIFISDNRAHCVKVFSYGGDYLRQIGKEGFTNYPIGVGIDSLGRVIVADNHNNFNVTIFTQDGQNLASYESKVKHAQCYDVALMDQNSIVLASKDYKIYVYRWGE